MWMVNVQIYDPDGLIFALAVRIVVGVENIMRPGRES